MTMSPASRPRVDVQSVLRREAIRRQIGVMPRRKDTITVLDGFEDEWREQIGKAHGAPIAPQWAMGRSQFDRSS